MTEIENESVNTNETNSFDEIKKVASANIGQMLQDLSAFEIAIKFEKIPEIYRIYNGRLHEQLKQTSNANHEIDKLLAQKLHDNFVAEFPFMVHSEKVSETMNYYTIGEYYRERPTIGLDSSIPEIFVLPQIDQEWQTYRENGTASLNEIEQQMDQLEAKAISAKAEVAKLEEQIKDLQRQETQISNSKGFFNRGKVDEELDELIKRREALEVKRGELLPYVDNQNQAEKQRQYLEKEYTDTRLKRAIAEKEARLITRYFGGFEEMHSKIDQFLADYLQTEPDSAPEEVTMPAEEVPANDK